MRIPAVSKSLLLPFCLAAVLASPLSFAEGSVNINTADAAALAAGLDGVGEARAKAIVAYREQNGPFASPEALLEVKGIGEKVLADNEGKITVK